MEGECAWGYTEEMCCIGKEEWDVCHGEMVTSHLACVKPGSKNQKLIMQLILYSRCELLESALVVPGSCKTTDEYILNAVSYSFTICAQFSCFLGSK